MVNCAFPDDVLRVRFGCFAPDHADDRRLQRGAIEAKRTIATRNALREGFDTGSDSLTPACDLYELEASALQGTVEKLVVTFPGSD